MLDYSYRTRVVLTIKNDKIQIEMLRNVQQIAINHRNLSLIQYSVSIYMKRIQLSNLL